MKNYLQVLFIAFLVSTSTSYCGGSVDESKGLSKSFVEVAKEAIPAVVYIEAQYKNPANFGGSGQFFDLFQDDLFRRFFGEPNPGFGKKRELVPRVSQGSGFFVSSDGVILTNHHLVQDADRIIVRLQNGNEFEAKALGKDPFTDLAVIKVEGSTFPHLKFGDSSRLEVGEWVVAIGSPLGLQASMTAGIVSATGRANLDLAHFEDFIQTDAAINRGNSGGPLLDLTGSVVGINTAIASNTGGYMGIGFAIPSNMAQEILRQILEKGSVVRSFIGIVMQPMTSDLAQAFGLKKVEGALISDVRPDSPAAQAGIERGDVLTGLNGKAIESREAFRNQIALMAPGTRIVLDVKKQNGTPAKIPLVLAILSEDREEPVVGEATQSFGLTVEPLNKENGKLYGYANSDEGVVIVKVESDTHAALLGLKKGMLILEVNRQKVTSPDEFKKAMTRLDERGGVLLLVKPDGASGLRFLYLKAKG